MAEVTIRNSSTQEERSVDETAVPFFPGWVALPKAGRANPKPVNPKPVKARPVKSIRPKPVTPTTSKES